LIHEITIGVTHAFSLIYFLQQITTAEFWHLLMTSRDMAEHAPGATTSLWLCLLVEITMLRCEPWCLYLNMLKQWYPCAWVRKGAHGTGERIENRRLVSLFCPSLVSPGEERLISVISELTAMGSAATTVPLPVSSFSFA
jgi:hypothetical protein